MPEKALPIGRSGLFPVNVRVNMMSDPMFLLIKSKVGLKFRYVCCIQLLSAYHSRELPSCHGRDGSRPSLKTN